MELEQSSLITVSPFQSYLDLSSHKVCNKNSIKTDLKLVSSVSRAQVAKDDWLTMDIFIHIVHNHHCTNNGYCLIFLHTAGSKYQEDESPSPQFEIKYYIQPGKDKN